jgi:hypothetical protein
MAQISIRILSVSSSLSSDLSLSLPRYSKVSEIKYLIQIEHKDHPSIERQKLIFQGRIPADDEILESFLEVIMKSEREKELKENEIE